MKLKSEILPNIIITSNKISFESVQKEVQELKDLESKIFDQSLFKTTTSQDNINQLKISKPLKKNDGFQSVNGNKTY